MISTGAQERRDNRYCLYIKLSFFEESKKEEYIKRVYPEQCGLNLSHRRIVPDMEEV